jgi:hypothetical protein
MIWLICHVRRADQNTTTTVQNIDPDVHFIGFSGEELLGFKGKLIGPAFAI